MGIFKNKLENFKNKFAQYGGKKKSKKSKKHNVSESDSDSDDDHNYKRVNSYITTYDQPFYYWWYDPSIYRLSSYYIPTFYSYVTPLIEISLF
jgi:hypothetical protein